jgi:hypothetical protein
MSKGHYSILLYSFDTLAAKASEDLTAFSTADIDLTLIALGNKMKG